MNIKLKPEDEQLIQKRLQSGVFHTVEEVIHDALTLLPLTIRTRFLRTTGD